MKINTGTLESVTDLTLFGGANAMAVESSLGQWEIVQAGEAELIATGRYRLRRLLRGLRGTEAAMGAPTLTGSRVVVLDQAVTLLPMGLEEVGLAAEWRLGPASRPVGDESFAAVSFTPMGNGLRPFSPAHLRAQPLPDGSIAISWIRRTRDLAGDSWVLPEVPLGETSEVYELDICNAAGSILRAVTGLGAPSFTYTSAMISDDLSGFPQPVAIRVAQIGVLGRGATAEMTLLIPSV